MFPFIHDTKIGIRMENAIVENRPKIWVAIQFETQLGNIFKLGNIAINLKIKSKITFPTSK